MCCFPYTRWPRRTWVGKVLFRQENTVAYVMPISSLSYAVYVIAGFSSREFEFQILDCLLKRSRLQRLCSAIISLVSLYTYWVGSALTAMSILRTKFSLVSMQIGSLDTRGWPTDISQFTALQDTMCMMWVKVATACTWQLVIIFVRIWPSSASIKIISNN